MIASASGTCLRTVCLLPLETISATLCCEALLGFCRGRVRRPRTVPKHDRQTSWAILLGLVVCE